MLGLELVLNGREHPDANVGFTDRSVLLRWEQPVYKNGLLGQVVAGHFWPRPDAAAERGKAWAVAGLKLLF